MSDNEVEVISDHEIRCPECGKVIDFLAESAEAHCVAHWGIPYRSIVTVRNAEVVRRYNKIMSAFERFSRGHLAVDTVAGNAEKLEQITIKEA